MVEVKQQGEERGLAAIFEKDKRGIQGVLGADGLPPTPCNLNASAAKYQLGQGQGYPAVYVFLSAICYPSLHFNLGILAGRSSKYSLTAHLKLNCYLLSVLGRRSSISEKCSNVEWVR